VGTSRPVQWQQADALQLPFDDGRFELVVCQFGAMFFPDKPRAFAEALAARFGRGAVDGQIQAIVIAVRKDA
jgi:ubiquinone/menaquinone biosynthesis C-methylase UbiE